MYYYLTLFILLAVFRLCANMRYIGRGIVSGFRHELGVIGFSMYLLFMFRSLKIYELDAIIILLIYVPIGFMVPLIFRKFRYLLLTIMYGSFISLIMSYLISSKVDSIGTIFHLIGVMCGFIIYKCFYLIHKNGVIKFYLRKRKGAAYNITSKMELELCSIFVILLMLVMIGINPSKTPGAAETFLIPKEVIIGYESVPYSIPSNYIRYELFREKNKDMDYEEIVWRINANLDYDFFEQKKQIDTSKDFLLINKFHWVSNNYEPEGLVPIEGKHESTTETRDAYNEMLSDMQEEGFNIRIASAYRSITYQGKLYNDYVSRDGKAEADRYSARPGHSEHHTGRALDLIKPGQDLNQFAGTPEAQWVDENAYKYGFIVRYKEDNEYVTGYIYEPWHITYVGKEISSIMHEEKIDSLEEYVAKYVMPKE